MRFNALAIENLMASRQDLTDRIFIHYSDQFVYQIHRMLGSADFLGNPGKNPSASYRIKTYSRISFFFPCRLKWVSSIT
jgi:hypothetical protein